MSVPAWFDKDYYLQSKLDQLRTDEPDAGWTNLKLAEALNNAGFNPFTAEGVYAHFEAYGHAEAVSPNPYFDVYYYMDSKLDQLKAAEPDAGWDMDKLEQAFKDAGLSAWDHFTLYGLSEGVDPSQYFDTSAYMAAKLAEMQATDPSYTKEQLAQAFTDAGLNPIEHYLLYGKDENLSYTPYPAPSGDTKPVVALNSSGGIASVDGDAGDTTLPTGAYAVVGSAEALSKASYSIINGANGDITLKDALAMLTGLDATVKEALGLASNVTVEGSLSDLVQADLPSEITAKNVSYYVNAVNGIAMSDVTVAKATDIDSVLTAFLSNPYVTYAENVTAPASADDVTVTISSVTDTVANLAAADLSKIDTDTFNVKDSAANVDNMTGALKAEITGTVTVQDSMANILVMKAAGDVNSFIATDTAAADFTLDSTDASGLTGKELDFSSLKDDVTSVNLTLSGDTGITFDASQITVGDGVTVNITGTDLKDDITAAAAGGIIDGGKGADTITLGAGKDIVVINGSADSGNTINDFSAASDVITLDDDLSGLAMSFKEQAAAALSAADVTGDGMIFCFSSTMGAGSDVMSYVSANIEHDFILVGQENGGADLNVWYIDAGDAFAQGTATLLCTLDGITAAAGALTGVNFGITE
ncbi:MAG: hypothetical protein MSH25_03140 [Desulfovibrio sp.]|uniref:hypothetical protein n=1 Tax=Desulfovibrio sp. TaxID=885 RepID=UPI0025B7ADEE|nr:hypothetical protein [Desulfovibrio sp.]MCI7568359.1 hypothetical protein [Desulfovibrio sp.]